MGAAIMAEAISGHRIQNPNFLSAREIRHLILANKDVVVLGGNDNHGENIAVIQDQRPATPDQ